MTAGKVQPGEDLASSSEEPGKAQAAGAVDEVPITPHRTGTSASDGPGIIHGKKRKETFAISVSLVFTSTSTS